MYRGIGAELQNLLNLFESLIGGKLMTLPIIPTQHMNKKLIAYQLTATTRKMTASKSTTGVINRRSFLLREIAFIKIPSTE